MIKKRFIVESISWERVQMYVKSRIEGFSDLKGYEIRFGTPTNSTIYKPTEVTINGEEVLLRFNVAILDDGNYLPSGDYLLYFYRKADNDQIVAVPDSQLFKPFEALTETEQVRYEKAQTETDRKNILLEDNSQEFLRGGTNKKYSYTVKPMISLDINELVFNVFFQRPAPKKSRMRRWRDLWIASYYKNSYIVRNAIFKAIFYTAQKWVPKNGKRVLFSSDSRSTLSGNFEYVYNKMEELGITKEYKVHMTFKPNIRLRRKPMDKFKFPFYLGISDIIFIDDFHPMIYEVKFSKEARLVQLWHACGAFKTVGFSRVGKKGGPFFDGEAHRNYSNAIVSADIDVPFYAEAFGIKEEKVLPLGVSRTDIFFDPEYKKNIVTEMEQLFPETQGKKVIMFAPTFRGNGANNANYPFFKINFGRLAEYCRANNAVVIFKMHPFVKNKLVIPKQHKDVFFDATSYREINDILFITDILITDYSSVIFEFSTLQRKMLFYAFDLEDYVTSRDFYEEYEGFVPGKIVRTFDDLITALEEEDFEEEKVKPFLDTHFKYQDNRSAERVVKTIFNKE